MTTAVEELEERREEVAAEAVDRRERIEELEEEIASLRAERGRLLAEGEAVEGVEAELSEARTELERLEDVAAAAPTVEDVEAEIEEARQRSLQARRRGVRSNLGQRARDLEEALEDAGDALEALLEAAETDSSLARRIDGAARVRLGRVAAAVQHRIAERLRPEGHEALFNGLTPAIRSAWRGKGLPELLGFDAEEEE